MRLPHLIVKVHAFFGNSNYCKHKSHNNADGCHAPIHSINYAVPEKHIYKVLVFAVVLRRLYTCKYIEELLQPADEQADEPLDHKQYTTQKII